MAIVGDKVGGVGVIIPLLLENKGKPSSSCCVLSEDEIRNKNDERTLYTRLFVLPGCLCSGRWCHCVES